MICLYGDLALSVTRRIETVVHTWFTLAPLTCFACHLLLNELCEIGNTSDDYMPLALMIKTVEALFCPDS